MRFVPRDSRIDILSNVLYAGIMQMSLLHYYTVSFKFIRIICMFIYANAPKTQKLVKLASVKN